MCDEPITELDESDRDGEVTSEREFALSIGTAGVSRNKCVNVFDLNRYKWQGMTAA